MGSGVVVFSVVMGCFGFMLADVWVVVIEMLLTCGVYPQKLIA